ncbi:family 2 glycosyltransferase [Leucosporidium creatinivorum]|uniref:Chitin synthase n=1 Tax=Leucosporidium creatinivorum TaxID=106004 RepID=A0A1Y2FER4_9BASI|nr:family 2 glycosyltransferase [Leucosporidium creatinivorum]
MRPDSAQSEAEWRRRAGPLARGATRKVKLTRQGHFIAEYPVPDAIKNSQERRWLEMSKAAGRTEFTHVRYSASTVDPNEFTPENGWSLRPTLYGRQTELLIACTSYNEDKNLLARTLHAVMSNVRDIVRSKSKFWSGGIRSKEEGGGQGWEKIVVALIADGLDPMDKGTLDLLATIGVYQDNVMKRQVDGKETVAHIFEYTTQLSVDPSPALVVPQAGNEKANMVPVQIVLLIKQKNAKKINSHRHLFNSFATQLNPEVCILIDVGTKPGPKSLYELWSCFYNSPHTGGACGEIYVMSKGGRKLINPLVAAQNFEYKMSNILDKPLESAFGYVAVLPGAFSAYRWKAVQGRPLQQYFLGDSTCKDAIVSPCAEAGARMYLAEDRILCFELVAKANASWTLTYVKTAKGETDVPEGVAELISQRRRWLNGSFAASVYSLVHFWKLFRTKHSILRLFFLTVQTAFNAFSLVFTWFSPANLYLSFTIIIMLLPDTGTFIFYNEIITHWVNKAFVWIYGATLALQFVLALGNRPKGEVGLYVMSFTIFGILAYYLLVCAVFLTVKAFTNISFADAPTLKDKLIDLFTGTNGVLLAALASTYGIYLVCSLLYFDPWHLITSFPAYIAVAPSMINILNVYAFCNLHDGGWGTKGSDKADALPSISSTKDGEKTQIVEEVLQKSEDLDAAFKETVRKALTPIKTVEAKEEPSAEDENKTFRTRLVSLWLLTNGALVVAIADANGLNTTSAEQSKKTSVYFAIILWSTAGLSLVRFVGSVYFW